SERGAPFYTFTASQKKQRRPRNERRFRGLTVSPVILHVEASMRPTILLADDCELLGIALGELIARTATLLERVKNGGELLERACVLRPDIIISDISMPVMNGLDVMRQLKAYGVPAKFIFLTGHAEEQLATEALSEGAAGFLVKPVVTEEMRDAIQAVAKGDAYVPRLIQARPEIAPPTRALEHASSADGRWVLLRR